MGKLTQFLVQWTPFGAGLGVTASFVWKQDWLQAAIATFITACLALWGKFSTGFMKQLEQTAEQRGETLAQALVNVLDRASLKLWLQLTDRFESKYYQRLIYLCRDFQTQGLDKDRILKLRQVFVPLKIAATEAARVSPDLIQSLAATQRQSAQKSAPSSAQKTASSSAQKSAQNQTQPLEIGNFLAAMKQETALRRLAILGAPGSGKTTLLRHLTLAYASRDRASLHPKAPRFVPVLLYLRDVYLDIVADPAPMLVELILRQVQRLHPSDPLQPPPDWFAARLRRHQCLILLDGLDEVADEGQRRQVSQWVDAQMAAYPDTPFILTSRPFGYQSAKWQQPMMVLAVKPFTLKQLRQFVRNWYLQTEIISRAGEDDLGVQTEAQEQADDLIRRIVETPTIAAMATNPLLLTMIATVHRRGSALPGKRVELYKEICQVLLEKRQRAKKLPIALSASQIQAVLQSLALAMMMCNTRKFNLSQSDRLIQAKLSSVSATAIKSEEFLKQVKDISGLFIAKEQEGVYEFAHLSFQEYLAAVEIKESNREKLLIEVMGKPEKLSWWAETIRLYAAQSDATNLIRTALKQTAVPALALAYDCLEEGKSVEPGVRQQLEEVLEAGLENR